MKTIALIDTHQGGHHLMYLRLVSKTLLELGYRVIALCPETAKLATWISDNCPQQIHQFHTFEVQEPHPVNLPIVGRLPQPFNVLARWHHAAVTIKNALSKCSYVPNLVFFNWIDGYLSQYLTHHIIEQIFPYPWSGLSFQPRLQSKRQGLVDYQAVLNSRHCRGVGVLDKGFAAKLPHKISHPIVTFPDVTDESPPEPNFSIVQQLRQQA